MSAISVREALRIVLDNATPCAVENIGLQESVGRVLFEDVHSDIDVEAFDESLRDGFALRSADVASASDANVVALQVIGTVGAGHAFDGEVGSFQAVRIMTGAPMPAGADCVIMFEDSAIDGERLLVKAPIECGTYVRKAGSFFEKGQVVHRAGCPIDEFDIGSLASSGNLRIDVYGKPVVGIISIGTELVDSHEVPAFAQKRDSNRRALAAMAESAGAKARIYPLVNDDPESVRNAYEEAISQCDIVVSTGGSCAGDFDYACLAISQIGDVKFDHIAMRPGKTQTFAVVSSARSGKTTPTLLFGLSGAPAAASIGFFVFVRTAIRRMLGYAEDACVDSRIKISLDEQEAKPGNHIVSFRIAELRG